MKLNKKVIFIIILSFVCIFWLNTKVKAVETINVENKDDFINAINTPEVGTIILNSRIIVSEDINVAINGNDKVLNLNGNDIIIEGNHKFVVNYNSSNKFILENSRGRGLISSKNTEETSRSIFTPVNNTNENVEMIINGGGIEAKALWIFEDTNGFNLTINKGDFRTLCGLFYFTSNNSNVILNRFTLKSLLEDTEESLRIAYYGKYSQDDISTIMGNDSKLTYINYEGESIDISNDTMCGEVYKNDGRLCMMPSKGLEISNITFEPKEYGYLEEELKQKNVSIKNISDEAIKVDYVILDSNDDISFSIGNEDYPDYEEYEIPSILPGNEYKKFRVKPINGLNPGQYYVIIIARTLDGEEYRAKATFEVTKAHLKNLSIDLSNWTYGDEANEPSSNGNLGNAKKTYEYAEKIDGVSNEDLEFTAQKPNKPGKYIVRLKVEETEFYYAGSATKEFEIYKKQIEPQVNIDQTNFIYSGIQIKPEITVTFTENEELKTLEKDLDYSLEYGENINAGIGTVTIKSLDTSNYIFDVTENFDILQKEILSENVKAPEFIKWTGDALYPSITVTDNEKELIKDIDYEVTYKGENGNVGNEILVTITGKGNYAGVIERNVTITQKKNQVLNFDENEITKVYNDSSFTITPNHTESDGEISYFSSNTDVVEVDNKTGKITIVGIGNAEITATASETQNFLPEKASYTIIVNKADYDMSKVRFENLEVVYDKNKHSIIATNLPKGVTVKYTNNDKVEPGEYKVIATFIGDTEHYNSIKDKEAILKINKTNYNMNASTLTIKAKNIGNTNISGIKDKTYTGKKLTQTLVIKDGNITLKEGKDYTLKYSSNKKIGNATVTILGKGNYAGTITKTYKIIPKGTKLKKLLAGKRQFKVTWKKQKTETSGYEVQYSTKMNFKSAKKIKIKKNKTTSSTVKKLKAKKKYYVRIRTYKIVNGKKIYSDWSKAKSVKTKK